MTQWWETPRPRDNRPPHTAWVDSACWARAMGWRGCTGTTAVPISMRLVAAPMTAAAVRASKSSGIWGTHTDASPASSAHRASARRRSTLAPYRPRSGPTMTPIRIASLLADMRTVFLLYSNHHSMGRKHSARTRPAWPERPNRLRGLNAQTGGAVVPEQDRLFIGGAWSTPAGTERIEVVSPHTGEVIATVPAAG